MIGPMVSSKKHVPLQRLIKRQEAADLLVTFEALLPYGKFALIEVDGQVFAGTARIAPMNESDLTQVLSHLDGDKTVRVGNLVLSPLIINNPLLGALLLNWTRRETHQEPTDILIALHQSLVLLLTQALEKRAIGDEALESYREINLLYRVRETINACLNPEEIPRLILDEIEYALESDIVAILLPVGPDDPTLEVKAHLGDEALLTALQEKIEALVQNVDTQGKPGMLTDISTSLGTFSAALCIPFKTQEQVLGVILLGRLEGEPSFVSKDEKLLLALASDAATALENARLFDQVQTMSASTTRLNEDLQQTYQKLQEVDELKSAFLGVITHELRSPFVAAGLSIQLIYRYLKQEMFDDLQSKIKKIDYYLCDGRRMIDSVIAFASLVSKRQALHLEESDIESVIRKAVAELEKMANARQVTISYDFSPETPSVYLDKLRMSEAIYQLAHNAIKFNREGGSVEISCWPTGDHVMIKVEDTGHGIPQEQLGTIWEAFTQEADDVKRGVEGLGLGLALVKFIVRAHGGVVAAMSKPGKGSTFGFDIPTGHTKTSTED
ncbi:MAG: ATP-binding protein [Chloroflexota bacterium]